METTKIRELCLTAAAASDRGELAKALAMTDAALALARDQTADPAADFAVHHAAGLALTADGWIRASLGNGGIARARFQAALVIGRALADDDPEHALAIYTHVARFLREAGGANDLSAARALEQESLGLIGATLGTDHLRYFLWRQAVETGDAPR